MKAKRVILIIIICVVVLIAGFVALYKDAIFQRGNPLPYISKMITLNETNSFARVFDDQDVYIVRYNSDALIKHIEITYDVAFAEQMGSNVFFNSDEKSLFADIEVYWRYYEVWELAPRPIVDKTFSLEDTNFYTMDFLELYENVIDIIDPENRQISIEPVYNNTPIEILFDYNGDIERFCYRLFVTINSTDTEFTMGSYMVSNLEESANTFEVHSFDSPIVYAKENYPNGWQEQFDFSRLEQFSAAFSGNDLKTLGGYMEGPGRNLEYYMFSSDNLLLRDYLNPNVQKVFFRLTSNGIEEADPAQYKSNEDNYPEETYKELAPEGNYPKTVFNNGESRYYLLIPYIGRPYSDDYISLMWNGVDYYSDVCIILFDEIV